MLRRTALLITFVAAVLLTVCGGSQATPTTNVAPTPTSDLTATSSGSAYRWDSFNVDIQVNDDGSMDITEHQAFNYLAGAANGSYRDILLSNFDTISQVKVAEAGGAAYNPDNTPLDLNAGKIGPPLTYQVLPQGDSERIIWFYNPTPAPATKSMVISYHITGGLRFYPGGDQLYWKPLPTSHSAAINAAQISVTVPQSIDLTGPQILHATYPDSSATVTTEAHKMTFTANSALGPDQSFEIRIQWPHGIINGTPSPWQVTEDTQPTATP